MQNLAYMNDLSGGVTTHVFKYADKPSLFFQCQVRINVKEDNKCQVIWFFLRNYHCLFTTRTYTTRCQHCTKNKRLLFVFQRTSDACPNPIRGKREISLDVNSTSGDLKISGKNFDVFSDTMIILDADLGMILEKYKYWT